MALNTGQKSIAPRSIGVPDKKNLYWVIGNNFKITVDIAREEDYLKKLKAYLAGGLKVLPKPPEYLVTKLRHQGVNKIKPLVEFVVSLLEQGLSVVLFLKHTQVLQAFAEELRNGKHNFNYCIVEGDTPKEHRKDFEKAFQAGHYPLFIGQIKACSTALTLTKAHHVVIGEMDFSRTNVSQAIDRCHRIGTKNSVNVYFPIVKNSLEEKVYRIYKKKDSMVKGMIDG